MGKKIKLFPRMEYCNGCIINQNGDISFVYALNKRPAFTRSVEECVRDILGVIKALRLLTALVIIHFQDRYYRRRFKAIPHENACDEIERANERFFDGRVYLEHQAYLFITITAGSQGPPPSVIATFFGKRLIPATAKDEQLVRKYHDLSERVMMILQREAGIGYRLLTKDEQMGTHGTTGLTEPYGLLEEPGGIPTIVDIDNRNGLRVGEKHVEILAISDASQLPPQLSPIVPYDDLSTDKTKFPVSTGAYFGGLLPCPHIANLYIMIEDRPNLLKTLDKRLKRWDSLAGKDGANLGAQEDIRAYREAVAKGEQQPVRMHANVIISSEDKQELASSRRQLVVNASKIGINLHLETLSALRLYASAIPGNAGELPITHTFPSFAEQASCLFVTETRERDCPGPTSIRFVDRVTGIPILADLDETPKRKGLINNYNKAIVGPSGSGKSVAVQVLLQRKFRKGDHLMVFDHGGSYKALCEFLGGRYFAFEEDRELRFNPFLLGEGELLDTEKLQSLVALIMILWKSGDQAYSRSEYIAVTSILTNYFAWLNENREIFSCFNTFYEWLRDKYVSSLAMSGMREKDFDWTNLLYVLRPYYRGGDHEQLLNTEENMNLLQERFVAFDLEHIKNHPILFPVVVAVLMELYVSKLRKLKGVRKVLVLDEAWKPLMTPVTSEFVKWVFKTVRKYNGEAIVATQDIEDLIGSPIVKNAIINNSDTKIILDVRKLMNRFDEFQSAMGLTEKDKTLLLSLNRVQEPGKFYKEFFVTHGGGHSLVYRLELSLEELMLYTTDEPQRIKVNEYAKQHGGLWKGIMALAADVRSGAVKWLVVLAVVICGLLLPNGGAKAQLIDIGEEIVKEALETADLKIQRLQTQTLLLQNAEKALENTMAGDLLDDITGWVQQQEQLFSEYYGELWQVKSALTGFSKVAQLIGRQAQLVKEYERATAAIQQDTHFSPTEVQEMLSVYSGILNASVQNTKQLALVIEGSLTQMDDAGRLRIIDEAATSIDHNYAALEQYNQENTLLSLQRAKDEGDIQTIKTLYGMQ